jgi:hypothetical protein
MSKHFYFIDGNVAAGQSTLDAITNESATFGIGATSILEPNELVVGTALSVGVGVSVSSGIVTSTGGFISGISTDGLLGVSTTPIQITLSGNILSFTAVGIGSTFFTLA